jgi:hypothetical protein
MRPLGLLIGVLYDARRFFIRPRGPDETVRFNDGNDLDAFVRAADLPAPIPFLAFRFVIGFTDNREDGTNRVVVIPVGWELGLIGPAGPVPVTAARVVAVENVHAAVRPHPGFVSPEVIGRLR